MPDVCRVTVSLGRDRFTTGFYRMDGDVLVMTDDAGRDVQPAFRHKMREGDNERSIAAVFTKKIRETRVSPFWKDLEYPELGIA